MFDQTRYKAAIKTLVAFKKSSTSCIDILLTEEEANRLQKKIRFRNLVFGFNPSANLKSSELKKYVVLKG